MGNPLFNALGGSIPQGNNMLAQFQEFKNKMKGINPQQEINRLLQSGAINQQQLNQAQQMAQQLQTILK